MFPLFSFLFHGLHLLFGCKDKKNQSGTQNIHFAYVNRFFFSSASVLRQFKVNPFFVAVVFFIDMHFHSLTLKPVDFAYVAFMQNAYLHGNQCNGLFMETMRLMIFFPHPFLFQSHWRQKAHSGYLNSNIKLYRIYFPSSTEFHCNKSHFMQFSTMDGGAYSHKLAAHDATDMIFFTLSLSHLYLEVAIRICLSLLWHSIPKTVPSIRPYTIAISSNIDLQRTFTFGQIFYAYFGWW